MIRNLKVLMLAAMALAAFGVLGASPAQAMPLYHCSVAPCTFTLKPDGAVGSKTAHHVFVIKNSVGESVSFTCNQLQGEGMTEAETATELTFISLKYEECNANGSPVEVKMNGCDYHLAAAGTLTIKGCEASKKIEVAILATGCIVTVGEQGPLLGVKHHNIGVESNNTTEVTWEFHLPINATLDGTKAQCLIDPAKTPITGEYTTGNLTVTGETSPGGVMKNAWWTA